ncbi:MAG: pentapeptide repeat-containing protein [candidate division WOR-3 bacterium]
MKNSRHSCKVENCPYPVSPHAEDFCCIFHTLTGKIKTFLNDKPVFIKFQERGEKERKIVKEFIQEFKKVLEEVKKDKKELICDYFVFPYLTSKEWNEMWSCIVSQNCTMRKKEFNFPVSFKNVDFGCEIDFKYAKFDNKVDFSDAYFSDKAIFESAQFKGPAIFRTADFEKNVNFRNAIFDEGANFHEVNFSGEAYFYGAAFKKNVNFENAKFNGKAVFRDTKFNRKENEEYKISFSDATFKDKVDFENAVFDNEINFGNVIFEGKTDFHQAKFNRKSSFSSTEFKDKVIFYDTHFENFSNFEWVKWNKEVFFINAIFYKKTNFENANFESRVYFSKISGGESMNFENVKFREELIFANSSILGKVSFNHAKFYKFTKFENLRVKFLDFTECEIFSFLRLRKIQKLSDEISIENEKVSLERLLLKNSLELVDKKTPPIILLRDLEFIGDGHLVLEDFDVSRTSFLKTNFYIVQQRVDFIRLNWDKKILIDDIFKRDEYKKWKNQELKGEEWEDIYKVIEEFEKENKEGLAEEIERCYRQIRLTYEAMGEYPDAGDFYLLEMNARKRRLKGFLKGLHLLYGWISNFGESIERATLWLLGVLGVSTILITLFGTEPKFNLSNWRQVFSLLGSSFLAVLNAITLGKTESLNKFGAFILTFTRIFGLIILTLLLLAIRRRFRR